MTQHGTPPIDELDDNTRAATRNDSEPLPPEGSEGAIALKVADKHHDELRYLIDQDRWLRWDGTRWSRSYTVAMFDVVKPYVWLAVENKRSASAATVAAVERLVRSDRRIMALSDQFDAEPFAFNTPGIIVDLRTGNRSPCAPLRYCTRCAAVAPRAGTPSRWLRFLSEITGNDGELVGFLQRMAGYMLTGDISEHALFFAHGTGANGKSVLVNTLRGVMGSYATSAPAEVFLATRIDRHPTELADLAGARLVTVSEVPKNRRWNEERIKTLTGGDPVKARYMRGDFFQYQPQFKLLIAGNSKPGLSAIDEAIRRRMNLLPFTVTIAKADRDPALSDTLRTEWPEILQWAIEGCIAWHARRLAPPDRVRAATDNYLASEDAFTQWLDDGTESDLSRQTPVAMLFASWKAWCEANNEPAGGSKQFSQALLDRGYQSARMTGGVRGFSGLRLKPGTS